jgi:hypothetical protein
VVVSFVVSEVILEIVDERRNIVQSRLRFLTLHIIAFKLVMGRIPHVEDPAILEAPKTKDSVIIRSSSAQLGTSAGEHSHEAVTH